MSEDPEQPQRTVIIGGPGPAPLPVSQPPAIPVSQPPAVPVEAVAPSGFVAPPPPPAPMRFGEAGALVGAVLNDNYEVTRYITQGGMGEIYEGRQVRGNVKVAIKVILPQFAADPEFYNLLEREADLLATLGHDAIVKFRGLSRDPRSSVDYLTLEYVPGPSIEDQLGEGPLEPRLARALLRRLASGLEAAHEKGVYHRDLSPDNILLRDGKIERATIIDFGIAKDADTSKKTIIGGGFGGKMNFAAPEAFGMFGREIGPWTDVYSLALVVAAAARGRVIEMAGASPVDAMQARQQVPPLDGVEPWLATVLGRMLTPDPTQRLRTMEEVIKAVDALPPVGTPFEAGEPEAAFEPETAMFGALPPAAPTAPMPAPTVPLPAPAAEAAPRFVRADATPAVAADAKARSSLPMVIGGGVAVAAAIGAYFAFAGGDPTPGEPAAPTEVASVAPDGTEAPAAPTAAAPAARVATDWPAARAALAALPCSDIRAVEPPAGSPTLRVAGWRAVATVLPASVGGYRLEAGAVAAIAPAPSPETCAIVERLKPATGDAGLLGAMQLAASTRWDTADLRKVDGLSQLPNGLASATEELYLVNIEDAPARPADRVGAFRIPAGTPAFPTGTTPVRYLQFFVSGPRLPADGAEKGTGAALARACTGGCASTSGWVVLE